MNYCSCCNEPKNDLAECEGCRQDVCEECCVGITYHNMVDYNLCKTCESLNEE